MKSMDDAVVDEVSTRKYGEMGEGISHPERDGFFSSSPIACGHGESGIDGKRWTPEDGIFR